MPRPSIPGVLRRIREASDAIWGEGRGWILTAVAAGWFLSLGVRLVFPALLPLVRTTFEFSMSTAGLVLALLWASYAIGQFPGGILGDRIGERNILVVSTVLGAGVVFAIAIAPDARVFFVGTILFGFATALYGPTRFTILSDVYRTRDSTAIGVTMAAGNVGNAVLPAAAGMIATFASWRLGFGFVVPLFLLAAAALWIALPERTGAESSAVDSLTTASLVRILRGVLNRPIVLVTGQMVLLMFAWQGFTGFYPTYLIAEKALDSYTAALLYGAFFSIGIVIQPLAGASSDRFGPRVSLTGVIGLVALALVLVPLANTLPSLIAVTILASSLLGVAPIANSFLVNALPQDMRGSGLGLLRSGYIALASTGPLTVGILADVGRFDEAFFLLAAVASIGLFLCYLLPKE